MEKFTPKTVSAFVMVHAIAAVLAEIARMCEAGAPMAGDILRLLIANGGDYDSNFSIFRCKYRALLLKFSADIRAGRASVPGFRLYWHYVKSAKHGRYREW